MRNIRMIPGLCVAGILASLVCSAAKAVDWNTRATVGIHFDNNLNNAPFASDMARDRAISASLLTSTSFPLRVGEEIAFSGELQGESFDRYSGMSNQSLGATLGWRKKWGLGALAPWTGVSLSSARLNFNNGIRNGWRHQLMLSAGQRMAEQWNLRGAYLLERRIANSLQEEVRGISGDVFSQSSGSLTLNLEYVWSDALLLDVGYLTRHGDVVATTRIHRGSSIFPASKAIAEDPVFGEGFYAYALTGTTQGLSLDAYLVLSRAWLLTLTMQRLVTHGALRNNYTRNMPSVTLSYDF